MARAQATAKSDRVLEAPVTSPPPARTSLHTEWELLRTHAAHFERTGLVIGSQRDSCSERILNYSPQPGDLIRKFAIPFVHYSTLTYPFFCVQTIMGARNYGWITQRT